MFADYETKNEFLSLGEVVINYLKQEVFVQPKVEGRIIEESKAKQSYNVQVGDWLSKIAQEFNTTWQTLQEMNHIKNPDLIFPGQKIRIP